MNKDDLKYLGVMPRKIDPKGRISIAHLKPIKPNVGDKFVLLQSKEGDCIDMLDEKTYNQILVNLEEKKEEDGFSISDKIVLTYSANVLGYTEVDCQHRIFIPKFALDKMGFKDSVVILGKFNKISIYTKENYESYKKSNK